MPIYVEIDGRSVQVALETSIDALSNLRPLYRRIAPVIRDMVRDNITNQSGGDGPWPPLARSTMQKTGRRKAFITLRSNIVAAYNDTEATAYYKGSMANWSLHQHAVGYITPARIPVRAKAMAWSANGKMVFTKRARPSVVPARNVFPNAQQVADKIAGPIDDWVRQELLKKWQ